MRRATSALLTLLPLLACAPAAEGPEPAPEPPATAEEGAPEAPADTVVPSAAPPEEVDALLGRVSPESLEDMVARLAGFGTRHTLSDTESDERGIGAARRWMAAELGRYAQGTPLTVSLDPHTQPADGRRLPNDVEIVNVVAVLPGAMEAAQDRYYYVIGHYDSRASDVMDAESDAPGANDDASGVALVMELARVMAGERFDSTLVFMATAGEEQGLYGARLHAAAARAEERDVRAVLSNDIVGDPTSPSGEPQPDKVRVFSQGLPANATEEELARIRSLGAESDSASRQLARYVRDVATWQGLSIEPLLVFRTDRFLRGGDHIAFNDEGFAAVRFSEVDETYERQHQDVRVEDGVSYGDLPEFVDAEYLADVTRLNGAVLAHLANAPSVPGDPRIVMAGLANDTTLRWEASPEPDVAGYEVVWRTTVSPYWEHARDVGAVTEATLPISKDNHFFGVRAYDRRGYRSPVGFAGAARE